MDWSDLPSLTSLRAFAAVAECRSFSKAGRALNVTHGAVIQQVRALEERLGVTLALRDSNGVRLTDEGASLARDLELGFASIRRGVETISEGVAERPVQVSMSPAFAVSWLMPRLVDFHRAHPEITLLLNPTAEVVELKPGGIDLAIRYTDRRRLKDDAEAVLVADMVVVGTPSLAAGRTAGRASGLADLPWLQELGTDEVADWMARQGVAPDRPPGISHMPGNLIMEAVRRGDGITYTARPFVEEEIRAGRLVELFTEPAFGVYQIRTRPGALRRSARVFVQWLKRQAAADGRIGADRAAVPSPGPGPRRRPAAARSGPAGQSPISSR